jgi:hypothetical protein
VLGPGFVGEDERPILTAPDTPVRAGVRSRRDGPNGRHAIVGLGSAVEHDVVGPDVELDRALAPILDRIGEDVCHAPSDGGCVTFVPGRHDEDRDGAMHLCSPQVP